MRLLTPSILAASCLLFSHSAHADTIVLKSGEKLEGIILREEDGNYVVEVRVTASIRDEKIIPRADVASIEKEAADEKAFRPLADLVPAPELLSAENYEARIEKLEAFLKDHPESVLIKKAQEMIDALRAEHDVISTGGFKFGDSLVTAEEYAANAYEHDARISEKRIKDAVARRDFLSALRMFDEYEANFGASEGRAGLAALMLQVLGAYRASVSESLATLDGRLKAREAGLERMSSEARATSERAINEEMDSLKKRFADEKAARVKWVTPDAFLKESMDETLRQITSETGRLERATNKPEISLAGLYRDSWEKLSGGSDEEKEAVLDQAKAKKMPETYLAKLRERAGIPEK